MKNRPHIALANRRKESDSRTPRVERSFPQIDHAYQGSSLRGSCGTPAKFHRGPAFFRLSNEYFAEEASRNFAVEAAVFGTLILTALLPIANGVQAVATLIHTIGVL